MPQVARPFPSYLTERYRAWRALRFDENRAWYARLAEGGQHPRSMIITCCDSRVEVTNLFGAEPGDLFVVRNVANLMPPFEPDEAKHGASAALEYAVMALKVAHVVVLGHSNCGGVAACDAMCAKPETAPETIFVRSWMSILTPSHARVAAAHAEPAARLTALEQESVLVSLRNLETFPFVRDAVAAGLLTLHGAWMDIGQGRLHVWSPETRRFHAVD